MNFASRFALLAPLVLTGLAFSAPAHAGEKVVNGVKETRMEYKDGSTTLEGVLYTPKAEKANHASVIVVHDWMGPGEYGEMRARQLAEDGYIAFAADVYGKGVRPKSADEAGKLAGKYKGDRKLLQGRILAAFETLKKQSGVDTARIGAIGFCFGGTTVLELARAGAPVKSIVTFHGGLENPTPANAKNIKAKALILHGALDPYVPSKEVEAFQKEMNDAKVEYELVQYSGAVHAFTQKAAGNDITKGAAYNEVAERRSMEAMRTFFRETL